MGEGVGGVGAGVGSTVGIGEGAGVGGDVLDAALLNMADNAQLGSATRLTLALACCDQRGPRVVSNWMVADSIRCCVPPSTHFLVQASRAAVPGTTICGKGAFNLLSGFCPAVTYH